MTVVENSTDADDLRECIKNAAPSPKYDALQKLINRYVDEFELAYILEAGRGRSRNEQRGQALDRRDERAGPRQAGNGGVEGGEVVYCETHIAPMPGDAGHLIVGIDVNQDIEKRNELTGLHTEAAPLAIGRDMLRAHPDWRVLRGRAFLRG